MPESIKDEIIRRSIHVTKTRGRGLDDERTEAFGLFKYKIRSGLITFRFIWIERGKNLRLNAMVEHEDGSYPDSVMMVNTRDDGNGIVETWHDGWPRLNEVLVHELRSRMLLDDIACVQGSEERV